MEQAIFDLELRAAPSAFRRVAGQIESASGELKALESQLKDRQGMLEKLSKQSEQWGAAIRVLSEAEAQAREHLANVGFNFHLVDLKFAAWRLKHSDLGDEGIEALPDALEQSFEFGPKKPGLVTPLPGAVSGSPEKYASEAASVAAAHAEEKESVEQGDAAFSDLLARANLAQGRLRFVTEVFQAEFGSVQAGISALEKIEEQAQELAEDTGRLAADQESLRRSLETEQQALTKGAEALDLVKKRSTADLKIINELLDTATERTSTLAKRLERG